MNWIILIPVAITFITLAVLIIKGIQYFSKDETN